MILVITITIAILIIIKTTKLDMIHKILLQTGESSYRNVWKRFRNYLMCFKHKHTLGTLEKQESGLSL